MRSNRRGPRGFDRETKGRAERPDRTPHGHAGDGMQRRSDPHLALIYGFHSVREALRAGRRKLVRLYATSEAAERLAPEIAAARVPVNRVATQDLSARLGTQAVHQFVSMVEGPKRAAIFRKHTQDLAFVSRSVSGSLIFGIGRSLKRRSYIRRRDNAIHSVIFQTDSVIVTNLTLHVTFRQSIYEKGSRLQKLDTENPYPANLIIQYISNIYTQFHSRTRFADCSAGLGMLGRK